CVDDDLAARLRDRFPEQCEMVKYGVSTEEARRFGLPCGGTLQMAVEPITTAAALQPALAGVERGQLLARRLQIATGAVTYVPATLGAVSNFDGQTLTRIFGPGWRLLIIGAGQTSRYLAQMAQALDYQVLICDPREEYARDWAVAEAEWLPGMPDDVVRAIEPDQRTVIVALTHDPRLDDMALMEALKTEAFYVGALGSMSNTIKRRERLALLDVTPTELARLHGPVGLPIGSRTPPEIAVSILAELTALRHGTRLIPADSGDAGR
ncbi:MAG: XdhC/CoxF family protein, partial [Synechococcaceae cyanobacterium SM1_2_3]|nr:XdhC/CoxF family protein [Synechococcaceae cyanobacterium SM1_2_3]